MRRTYNSLMETRFRPGMPYVAPMLAAGIDAKSGLHYVVFRENNSTINTCTPTCLIRHLLLPDSRN